MSYFKRVRVRIAPSPTGDPHVGTAYIALFNYVFAKKHGGDFILRIEDTDQVRARASSEQQIMQSLRWLGIQWDEGPEVGGEYGPYHQSQRRDIYDKHVQELLQKEHAYYCFCSTERMNEVRQKQMAAGQTTGYDRHCRNLPAAEVKKMLSEKMPYVVRLKMPLDGSTVFHDEIRGEVSIENSRLDDQVLMKSDGFPTYHLANVVDDHLMKISHVIRAEEWISSTPKHVVLYQAFGWEMPKFAHFPLLRNADKSKISKRKSPVSLDYYRRKGILPQTLLNFLGLMGWSFGNDVEIFTVPQMVEKFEFKGVHLGGPVFDLNKLTWLNHHYLKQMDEDSFVKHLQQEVFSVDYLKKMRPLIIERMDCFEKFVDNNAFFFNGALSYQGLDIVPAEVKKEDFIHMVDTLLLRLDDLYHWDDVHLKEQLDNLLKELGWKSKHYFMPIRLIVTGRKDSPPLVESMTVLGREMVRFRLRDALQFLRTT